MLLDIKRSGFLISASEYKIIKFKTFNLKRFVYGSTATTEAEALFSTILRSLPST